MKRIITPFSIRVSNNAMLMVFTLSAQFSYIGVWILKTFLNHDYPFHVHLWRKLIWNNLVFYDWNTLTVHSVIVQNRTRTNVKSTCFQDEQKFTLSTDLQGNLCMINYMYRICQAVMVKMQQIKHRNKKKSDKCGNLC